MRLRRAARRHEAGVDATLWHDFQPGDRVLTSEGIFGRVVAVEDGPHAGNEQYVVELELGLGGGEYSASELRHPDSDSVEPGFGVTAAITDPCAVCGLNRDNLIHTASEYDLFDHYYEPPTSVNPRLGAKPGELNWDQFPKSPDGPFKDGERVSVTIEDVTATGTFKGGSGQNVYYVTLDGTEQTVAVPGFSLRRLEAALDVSELIQQAKMLVEAGMTYSDVITRLVGFGIAPYAEVVEAVKTLVTGSKIAARIIYAECEDCRFAGDGVIGHKSEESLRKGIATHQANFPNHTVFVDEYDDDEPIGSEASKKAVEQHVASEDYPELSEILVERPPLPHSERIASKIAGGFVLPFKKLPDGRIVDEDGSEYHDECGDLWADHDVVLGSPVCPRPVPKPCENHPDRMAEVNISRGGGPSQLLCNECAYPVFPPRKDKNIYIRPFPPPGYQPRRRSSKVAYEGEGWDDVQADLNLAWRKGREDGALGRERNTEGMNREEAEAYLIGYREGEDFGEFTGSKTAGYVIKDDGGFIVAGPFASRTHAAEELELIREDDDAYLDAYTLYIEREDSRAAMLKHADFWDKVLEPIADRMIENQDPRTRYNPQTGQAASYDWCRFRRDRHCYYPKQLNQRATEEAGYPVWVPEHRGICPYDTWGEQKVCPAPSEPGPNANHPSNLTDATIPWESGGQRYDSRGVPVKISPYAAKTKPAMNVDEIADGEVGDNNSLADALDEMMDGKKRKDTNPYGGGNPYTVSVRDPEFTFHFTSAWRDVQEKASRIRQGGHVRIISSSPAYLVGEVRGDTNLYQATLHRDPGTDRVALWECGCAWAAYSWGRSGRWKKYEGRMCSHALALHYEGQSRGWGGKTINEDRQMPGWRSDPSITVKVPGDYKKPDYEWRVDAARKTAGPNAPTFEGNYVVIDPKGQAHVLDPYIWGVDHITGETVRRTVELYEGGDTFSSALKTTCCGRKVTGKWGTFGLIDSYDEAQWYGEEIKSICSKIQRTALRKTALSRGEYGTPAKGKRSVIVGFSEKAKGEPVTDELTPSSKYVVFVEQSGDYRMGRIKIESWTPEVTASMRKGAPFAGYEDFDACVAANQDKDDPEAYCGSIKSKVEGMKPVSVDGSLREAPAVAIARSMQQDGDSRVEVSATLQAMGVASPGPIIRQADGWFRKELPPIPIPDAILEGGNFGRIYFSAVYDELKAQGYSDDEAQAMAIKEYRSRFQRTDSGGNVMGSKTSVLQWKNIGNGFGGAGYGAEQGDWKVSIFEDEEPTDHHFIYVENSHTGEFYEYYASSMNRGLAEDFLNAAMRGEADTFDKIGKTSQADSNPYIGPKVKCVTGRCKDRTTYTTNINGICSRHPEGKEVYGKALEWERNHKTAASYLRFEIIDKSAQWIAGRIEVAAYIDSVSSYLPVGRLSTSEFPDEGWVVDNVAVVESFRRQGIATAMLAEASRHVGQPVRLSQTEFADYTPDGAAWAQSQGASVSPNSGWTHGDMNRWITGKTAQADSEDGAMIAFRPPAHILDALEGDASEDYDNLHVTVAFLGKSEDINKSNLEGVVAEWASRWQAQPAKVSGYGLFENGGPDKVLVALMDMPGFEDARADLLSRLAQVGIHPMRNHGYTPHLTLAYGADDTPDSMPDEAKVDFQFSSVYVVYGPDWHEVAFTGGPKVASSDDAFIFEGYIESELNDEPEPALPETTGEEVDADEFMGDETDLAGEPHEAPASIVQEDPDLQGERMEVEGVKQPEWLNPSNGGGKDRSSSDIAQAARQFLAKTALKDFTPAEQKMLIDEGEAEGVVASNLDRLDIAGTHYETLEEAMALADASQDDEVWLSL